MRHEGADRDLSTWPYAALRDFAGRARGQEFEAIRVVAQGHAYHADDCPEARRWAALSLLANRRLLSFGGQDRVPAVHQDLLLRMWVIDRFGPDDADPVRSAARLAADTLAELGLTSSQAGALADRRDGPTVGQIRELRRHKNLTAHVERLVVHLGPGPERDALLPWIGVRPRLP
jgi:hypothetical protein